MRSASAHRGLQSRILAVSAALCTLTASGCTWISRLGTDSRGSELGKTFYLGGAGPFGHVGTINVPKGLRLAGYRGAIEVFGWQSTLGGALRDQIDQRRNRQQARILARRIDAYLRRYPGRRVNLIALSAGTGITTWALEALSENRHVGTVVFLSSSLSRDYDLRAALRHVDDKLYNFYSPDDPILRYAIPLAGSVDRETREPDVAGLFGFVTPGQADAQARVPYARLRNKPYRRQYRNYGYYGMHADSTSVDFVQHVIAPLLMRPLNAPEAHDSRPAGEPPAAPESRRAVGPP